VIPDHATQPGRIFLPRLRLITAADYLLTSYFPYRNVLLPLNSIFLKSERAI
jgi:hypothetical protein